MVLVRVADVRSQADKVHSPHWGQVSADEMGVRRVYRARYCALNVEVCAWFMRHMRSGRSGAQNLLSLSLLSFDTRRSSNRAVATDTGYLWAELGARR